MRKSCYIIFSALTFYLAGVYRADALMILFFAEVFLFIVMFLLSGYLSGKTEVKMELESDTIKKGESVTGRIWVLNRSWLLAPRFEVRLKYYHREISGYETKTLHGYLTGKGPVRMEFQISSKYCGVLHVGMEVVKTYDYLMLFGSGKKMKEDLQVLVLPVGRPMRVEADWNAAVKYPSGGEQRLDLSGNHPPEVYQIRQYQDGDSMRDIHWKLSAKMDQLMSRQYAAETQCMASIYLDFRRKGDETIRHLDAFRELAAAILRGFLEAGTDYRVCWYDIEKRCAAEKIVRAKEDYREMQRELVLCSAYAGDAETYASDLPEAYRFWRPDETFLRLDMKLQLWLNEELLMQFSEDDYEQEIEKRWISV